MGRSDDKQINKIMKNRPISQIENNKNNWKIIYPNIFHYKTKINIVKYWCLNEPFFVHIVTRKKRDLNPQ